MRSDVIHRRGVRRLASVVAAVGIIGAPAARAANGPQRPAAIDGYHASSQQRQAVVHGRVASSPRRQAAIDAHPANAPWRTAAIGGHPASAPWRRAAIDGPGGRWFVDLGGSWVAPDGVFHDQDAGAGILEATSEFATFVGVEVAVERRVHRRFGVEAGLLFSAVDTELTTRLANGSRATAGDRLAIVPVFAALNVHFNPAGRVDVFAAPVLGYVAYDNLEFALPGGVQRADARGDAGAGLQIGVTVPFGSGDWAFRAVARYLDTELELVTSGGVRRVIQNDIGTITVGASRRF